MRNKRTVLAILLLAVLFFLPSTVEGKTGTGSEPAPCLSDGKTGTGSEFATCLSPFSPFGPTPPLTSGEFKVLSFNIRYSRGNDGVNSWRFRKDMVVDLIRREAPDFLGLQEAMIDPDPDYDQVGYIAERLPEYDVIVRSRNVDPTRDEACPIFYLRDRWELDGDRHGTYWLSDTPDVPGSKSWGNDIPRIATWAVFIEKETDRRVLIVNTHFDHQSEESRQKSAELVLRCCCDNETFMPISFGLNDTPSVLMGDFNCGEDSYAIRYLQNAENRISPNLRFLDTFRVLHNDISAEEAGTFGAWIGRISGPKIDYVFSTPELEVRNAEILHDNESGRNPSDHFPVSAVLRLQPLPAAPLAEELDLQKAAPRAENVEAPMTWILSGGEGNWLPFDKQFQFSFSGVLQLTGTGEGSSQWTNSTLRLEPRQLYRFSANMNFEGDAGGCVPMGTSVHHRDYQPIEISRLQETCREHIFFTPENAEQASLRLSQWETTGTVSFNDVNIRPVEPIHFRSGNIVLGEGESIRDDEYRFNADYSWEGSNYHRPLQSALCGFNSNRWCFGTDSDVIYKFEVPDSSFGSGVISLNVNYYTAGILKVDVSTDGVAWTEIASVQEVKTLDVQVPESMLPMQRLFIRMKTEGPANIQVDRFSFNAQLNNPPDDMCGETVFAEVIIPYQDLRISSLNLEGELGSRSLLINVENLEKDTFIVEDFFHEPILLSPDSTSSASARVPLDGGAGQVRYDFAILNSECCRESYRELAFGWHAVPTWASIGLNIYTPDFYRSDYGSRLVETDNAVVWECEADWKVARNRNTPGYSKFEGPQDGSSMAFVFEPAINLSAARNEAEAVQCVVRAENEPIENLKASVSDLTGPDGVVIPSEEVDLLRVYYHWVENPTDAAGCTDWWPDALPPMDAERVDVAAGENQPIWILVHVPEDVPAGTYEGVVSLDSDGEFNAEVPIVLTVWDFTLPDETTLETAFGLSYGNIDRYHGLETEEEKRAVYELYQESFAEHRISPYDWTPLDHMRVQFDAESDPPSARLDMDAYLEEMQRVKETHHFNTFRLGMQGMGGGTFHARSDPKIGEFGEESPEYQAMFADYARQLETRLDEAGLLDEAFVYWFDEPDPKDYEFVANGFKRLEQYAPRLRRMITEEPNDGFLGAEPPIDIWCPVSHNFSVEEANARMDLGERFWWYVCCGPKTPHAGLFIDHPATELRVWTWQAWQRGITGELVWQSNYWHSNTAFPDTWQDPYEDPMGYVSGYSTPSGTKRFWGNGDGRFIYPPLAARTPGASGEEPVLEGPVSSIRWEMLREGIEDYEYLSMLKRLIEERREELTASDADRYERLLEMDPGISESMTSFTKTPAPIMRRRQEIAEAIVELNR